MSFVVWELGIGNWELGIGNWASVNIFLVLLVLLVFPSPYPPISPSPHLPISPFRKRSLENTNGSGCGLDFGDVGLGSNWC
ncbi:MAG: hypothetical protein F6K47_19685 [Symploca sp. SIO2E6]|nr:hypothetical protein [Symploca sp. SIO2E6]